MSVLNLIQSLEAKVKELETKVAASLAQYHGLSGILAGLNESLSVAKNVIDDVMPSSAVAAGVNAASEVVNAVDESVVAAEPIASDASVSPVDVPQ